MFYPVVNHGVKREGSPTRKPRTEPNLILEVLPEEQCSDNGLDDHLADAYAAGIFYQAALQTLSWETTPPQTPTPTPAPPPTQTFEERMSQMQLDSDNSDDDQGSDSGESYGKVDETAP